MTTTIKAIDSKKRIQSLDVIRGFAILGILLMNIQSFSMVGQAYLNPMAYGDMTGINKWIWILSHIFADQKFMTIFSMLFGASIIMIIENAQLKGESILKIHYSRNFWLLVIGLGHAYLLWYGDILFPYAVCAMFLYFFKGLSVKKLIIIGISVFSVASIIYLSLGYSLPFWPDGAIEGLVPAWKPTKNIMDEEITSYLGDFSSQMAQRMKTANTMHSEVFLFFYIWRISGLMMLGMALFKSGFLQGQLRLQVYRQVLVAGGLIGFVLVSYGVVRNFQENWSLEYSMFQGSQYNYWGSLLISMAYISGMVMIVKTGRLQKLMDLFSAVGRMALTNYLLQTIICTFIFYGFGFGLFGEVERTGQWLIILGVWSFQLIVSPIWLNNFKYGPFEWFWRSATFLRVEKMKK